MRSAGFPSSHLDKSSFYSDVPFFQPIFARWFFALMGIAVPPRFFFPDSMVSFSLAIPLILSQACANPSASPPFLRVSVIPCRRPPRAVLHENILFFIIGHVLSSAALIESRVPSCQVFRFEPRRFRVLVPYEFRPSSTVSTNL